jgi:hypothetical protein
MSKPALVATPTMAAVRAFIADNPGSLLELCPSDGAPGCWQARLLDPRGDVCFASRLARCPNDALIDLERAYDPEGMWTPATRAMVADYPSGRR